MASSKTGSGHFVLNGLVQADNREIDVSAALLPQLIYQSVPGTMNTLDIRAADQNGWGGWASFVATAPALVIQTDTSSYGSTSLTELGDNYFLNGAGGTTGPELKVNGVAVVAGTLGGWIPIGAVRTASGYEVAFKLPGTNLFTIWNDDSDGNHISGTGSVSGTSTVLEQAEATFNQDLNGDGTIGIPTVVISTNGSTQLTEVGDNYFLYAAGGTTGPELKVNGAAVVAGTLGGWIPIGAVRTASGYEVALKLPGTNLFTIWNDDSDGNHISGTGSVSGTSTVLEQAEATFNQDLNGDGTIGIPTVVISTNGSTQLTEVGDNYFLYAAGGTTGPELKVNGAAVVAGTLGGWIPIGAVRTASGYEVALKLPGTNLFTIWNDDSDGNHISGTGSVSGTSTVLEQAEATFNQDLNGDGVVGLYATPSTTLQIVQPLAGTSGAATVGAHATLELTAADSASVTFAASTGMLKLDRPSTFAGEIFGLTGNGTLTGSDQIDLKGINNNTVQDSYANGILTVTDGTNTAHLSFSGSYSLGNFEFASDGNGGTIVYDPPVSNNSAPIRNTVTTDHSTDVFLFGPQLEQAVGTDHRYESEAVHFDHARVACGLVAPVHDAPETMITADAAHDVTAFRDALVQSHQAHFHI